MLSRFTHDTVTWYDVVTPTSEEVRQLVSACNLPIELTADLTTPSPQSDCHWRKGIIKITLDFPTVKRPDMTGPHEVKFIAGKDFLITIRFEDVHVIEQFQKDFEVVGMLKRAGQKLSGVHLFHTLLLRLYTDLDSKLDYLASRLSDIDEEIFKQHEREMVTEIAVVGRRLLTFRQTVEAHENALGQLYTSIEKAFGKPYQSEVLRINEQYLHILRRTTRVTSALQELRETNNSLINTKQNEIMKTLTIMAFVTFPLTLVSSIFGMNTEQTPIVGHPYDFWIIIGFMSTAFGCFFLYFYHKNWL
jgi:magnesium transporter